MCITFRFNVVIFSTISTGKLNPSMFILMFNKTTLFSKTFLALHAVIWILSSVLDIMRIKVILILIAYFALITPKSKFPQVTFNMAIIACFSWEDLVTFQTRKTVSIYRLLISRNRSLGISFSNTLYNLLIPVALQNSKEFDMNIFLGLLINLTPMVYAITVLLVGIITTKTYELTTWVCLNWLFQLNLFATKLLMMISLLCEAECLVAISAWELDTSVLVLMFLIISFPYETHLTSVTGVWIVPSVLGLVGFQLMLIIKSFGAILTGKSFAFMPCLVCFVIGFVLKPFLTFITPKLELTQVAGHVRVITRERWKDFVTFQTCKAVSIDGFLISRNISLGLPFGNTLRGLLTSVVLQNSKELNTIIQGVY